MTRTAATLTLMLALLPLSAKAAGNSPAVPPIPGDSEWVFVHQTESGLRTYIAKTSLKVLRDRSGFAVWLKLARPEDASMAPLAAYMLHDCEKPRRMRLGRAIDLRTRAQSAEGSSAWLPDVPISAALKQDFCPKIAKVKAQEERDRTPVRMLANSTVR